MADAIKNKCKLNRVLVTLLGFLMIFSGTTLALEINEYPVLVALSKKLVEEDGYPKDELMEVFRAAKIDSRTLELMDKQYEGKPWHEYRKIFINQSRINLGIQFMAKHKAILDKAYDDFGVPPWVVSALIGVETHYGKRMGNKSVLDSLVTLSAAYPRRSSFFTKELRVFLNTTRKENIPATDVVGSYAGAIGIPQFMPSSYEAYAVDFNQNNKRDLVNEVEDAIGSVANYLKTHGWVRDQAIYSNVMGTLSDKAQLLVTKKSKPIHSQVQLKEAGVDYDGDGGSQKVALLTMKEQVRERYVVGFNNFYVLTRYNTSNNYAMVISQLAQIIKQESKN